MKQGVQMSYPALNHYPSQNDTGGNCNSPDRSHSYIPMGLLEWAQEIQLVSLHRKGKIFGFFCLLNKGWRWHRFPSGFRCCCSFPCSSSPFQLAQSEQICRQLMHTAGGWASLFCMCKVEPEFILTKIWLEVFVKFSCHFSALTKSF